MRNLDDLLVYFANVDGKWLAATGRAPFFCLAGSSESEVTAKAKQALAFYRNATSKKVVNEKPSNRGSRRPTWPPCSE